MKSGHKVIIIAAFVLLISVLAAFVLPARAAWADVGEGSVSMQLGVYESYVVDGGQLRAALEASGAHRTIRGGGTDCTPTAYFATDTYLISYSPDKWEDAGALTMSLKHSHILLAVYEIENTAALDALIERAAA